MIYGRSLFHSCCKWAPVYFQKRSAVVVCIVLTRWASGLRAQHCSSRPSFHRTLGEVDEIVRVLAERGQKRVDRVWHWRVGERNDVQILLDSGRSKTV